MKIEMEMEIPHKFRPTFCCSFRRNLHMQRVEINNNHWSQGNSRPIKANLTGSAQSFNHQHLHTHTHTYIQTDTVTRLLNETESNAKIGCQK